MARLSPRLFFTLLLAGGIGLYLFQTNYNPAYSVHSQNLHAPRVLLVTAYYPLPKSKHTQAEYDHWLTNFMGQLSTDLYIFTTPAYESHIQELIAKAVNSDLTISRNYSSVFAQRKVYYDTRYQSPLTTPPLSYFASRVQDQWEKDPEKAYHNAELYAIWDSKAYFVGEAVRAMVEARAYDATVPKYKYVFWEDAGAMRADHKLQAWPDVDRVDSVFREAEALLPAGLSPTHPLVMFPLWRRPYEHERQPAIGEDSGPITSMLVEGSFFGGTPSSVLWFEIVFYELLDRLLARDLFVGKDQDVFNLLLALNPTNFVAPIPNAHPDLENWGHYPCGDTWFYYQPWLASSRELAETEEWRGRKCPMVPAEVPYL